MHTHRAHLDLGHPPRMRAEKEDVPGHRLDREVLVHRSDRHAFGVEHDAVVAGLGNGAATGQRSETRTTARPQAAVDRVEMQVRAAPSAPRLDAPAGQGDHLVEVRPWQCRVRGGLPGHLPQLLDPALFHGGDLGHELLGQHVERSDRGLEQVEPAVPHGRQQRRAFDELVARHGIEAPAGIPSRWWLARPTRWRNVPMARGEPIWQTSSTGPTSMPEFQRGGRHQRAQIAGPQSRLDDATAGGRETAMMRRHQQRGVHVVTVSVRRCPTVLPVGAPPARPSCGC